MGEVGSSYFAATENRAFLSSVVMPLPTSARPTSAHKLLLAEINAGFERHIIWYVGQAMTFLNAGKVYGGYHCFQAQWLTWSPSDWPVEERGGQNFEDDPPGSAEVTRSSQG